MISSGIAATLDNETNTFKGVSGIANTWEEGMASITSPLDSARSLTEPFTEQAERIMKQTESLIPETGNTYSKYFIIIRKGRIILETLTNEQRAHDLAIASLPFTQQDPSVMNLYTTEDGNQNFDVYTIYLNLYKMALESFNRDFPNN